MAIILTQAQQQARQQIIDYGRRRELRAEAAAEMAAAEAASI